MRNTLKIIVLLGLIGMSTPGYAQPYESLFGNSSTFWIIKWYNLDFGGIDTIVVEKDTSAFGFDWKKIVTTQNSGFFSSGALLREDTLAGKVWYRPLEPGVDSIYLAFDFTLGEGDSFDLSSNHDPNLTSVIVDSISTSNSGKRILFDSFIEESENIAFIEGVGGNQGPIYKQSNGFLDPYLLCAFKDGIQTYSNISYEGNCSPPSSIEQTEHLKSVDVYPNPFDQELYIKTTVHSNYVTVALYDSVGGLVRANLLLNKFNVLDLEPGLYYLRLVTKEGEIFTKAVVNL